MPTWVKMAIEAWTKAAVIAEGHVFRTVNRGGAVQSTSLNEKVVWQLLQGYAAAASVLGIAPHDLRRYAECRIMQKILSRVPRRRESKASSEISRHPA
jgi:hypothetical protein